VQLWQLEALLLQRDEYMTYSRPMSSGSATQWSQTLGDAKQQQGCGRGGASTAQQWWRCGWSPQQAASEGWRRAWVLALWLAAMAVLFAWKFAEYRRSPAFRVMGFCLPTAKGAAETLKLNMALVLLPVCRNTLTWLRSSWARFFVPFDDSIAFHKVKTENKLLLHRQLRCGPHPMAQVRVRRSPSVARTGFRRRRVEPAANRWASAAWGRGRVVVKATADWVSAARWGHACPLGEAPVRSASAGPDVQ
jgi:hypothetical protein